MSSKKQPSTRQPKRPKKEKRICVTKNIPNWVPHFCNTYIPEEAQETPSVVEAVRTFPDILLKHYEAYREFVRPPPPTEQELKEQQDKLDQAEEEKQEEVTVSVVQTLAKSLLAVSNKVQELTEKHDKEQVNQLRARIAEIIPDNIKSLLQGALGV